MIIASSWFTDWMAKFCVRFDSDTVWPEFKSTKISSKRASSAS